jgi:hypothetical protein
MPRILAELSAERAPEFRGLERLPSQLAKKVVYFVIPSEARNLSLIETQDKRDSSARGAPRNNKIVSFSAACSGECSVRITRDCR